MSTETGTPGKTGEKRRRGGLLWQRDFRLLWIGETVSKLGSNVTTLAVPLVAVVTLHASAFQVSVLLATTWLPWLLIGVPAGAWVDRLPGRRVMLVCDAVSMASLTTVLIAAWLDALTIAQLVIATLLMGTATVFFETSYLVYLPSLVRPEDLTEGNAKLQGSAAAAGICGPGVAGLVAQVFGAVFGLLADVLSFLVSAICLLAIGRRPRPPREARQVTGFRREIMVGLRFVISDRYLLPFALYGIMANLALNGYQAVLIVFLVNDLGISPGATGGLIASVSLGGVLGASSTTWVVRHFGSARGLLLGLLCSPFALLMPLAGPGFRLGFWAVGAFMLSFGLMVGNVIKGTFRAQYVPPHLRGRVSASMQFLMYGAIPLGALLGGVLSALVGIRSTIWLTMGTFALSGLILLASPLRVQRDLPGSPPSAS